MSPAGSEAPLQLNAWLGPQAESHCALGPGATGWLNDPAHQVPLIGQQLYAPKLPNYRNWRDPRVGWSLLLPHHPGLNPGQLAQPIVEPNQDLGPLGELWEERGKPPIYRYDPQHDRYLIRWAASEPHPQALQPEIAVEKTGLGVNQIPYYLLIYGSPERIPWEVQFWLNPYRAVGRLDLEEAALANYVRHLRTNWSKHRGTGCRTLVWSTAHDAMTCLMHRAVATELHEKYRNDPTSAIASGAVLIEKDEALGDRLATALGKAPGLIVTPSHGCMDLNDPKIDERLGVPVDQSLQPLDAARLLQAWHPQGAIWFVLACCSAGTLHQNSFSGLIAPGSGVHGVLESTAQRFGSRIAPLPRLLLGASQPARAFIGHVEPTFDRALKNPETKEFTTGGLLDGFYNQLFQKKASPIGYALQAFYRPFVNLREAHHKYRKCWNGNDLAGRDGVLTTLLRALDVTNMVLLGDPTVRLTFPKKPG